MRLTQPAVSHLLWSSHEPVTEQVLIRTDVYNRWYPPLSISLPFLAVGALPMMTTCQRAIRGFSAALQPPPAGLISIRSERCFPNPAVPNVISELLVFNGLTAADAVPRRDGVLKRAHSLHGHRLPETDTELKSDGSYRRGIWVAGASLDRRAELGAVGLNTEDPVFACPSLQPPPNEPPRLPTSPQAQTNDTRGGNILNQVVATCRYRSQLFKK